MDDQRLKKRWNTLFDRADSIPKCHRITHKKLFKSIYFSVDPLAQAGWLGISVLEQAPCALACRPIWESYSSENSLKPRTLVSANIPSITISAPPRVMRELIRSGDNGEWRIYLRASSHNHTFSSRSNNHQRVLNPPSDGHTIAQHKAELTPEVLSLLFGKCMQ